MKTHDVFLAVQAYCGIFAATRRHRNAEKLCPPLGGPMAAAAMAVRRNIDRRTLLPRVEVRVHNSAVGPQPRPRVRQCSYFRKCALAGEFIGIDNKRESLNLNALGAAHS